MHFEKTWVSELVRKEATGRHRVLEDRLMLRLLQCAFLNLQHGHFFGICFEKVLITYILVSPSTSQQEAFSFVITDVTAQLCLRILQLLSGLASKPIDSDKQEKGWYLVITSTSKVLASNRKTIEEIKGLAIPRLFVTWTLML